MGRDLSIDYFREGIKVSTHAPAWGATIVGGGTAKDSHVSTHAPAWGATAAAGVSLKHTVVSTHAPAWGATTRTPLNEKT